MTARTETHTGTIAKVWPHELSDSTGVITAFTLDDIPGAFWMDGDSLDVLIEAHKLRTRCRVTTTPPAAPKSCGDPMCGDGCCDNPDCTNVPADERTRPFLLRADSIEWL